MQPTDPEVLKRGLSFAPFATLSCDELRREERYWLAVVHQSEPGRAVHLTAERHRQRCLETMRERA